MKIGILIASLPKDEKYTNADRLVEASEKRGHEIVKIYEPSLSFTIKNGNVSAFHDGEPLLDFDLLIYRPNFIEEPGIHSHNLQLLKRAGYKIVNGDEGAIAITKNKLAQHALFLDKNIPMPRWAIANGPVAARKSADEIGYPVIIKTAFGTFGTGVFYAENSETFLPIVEYLNIRDGNPVLIEEFVNEADRKDLRVFIVGGKIIASMERTARPGDVRANASIGGVGHAIKLSPEEERLAIRTANLFDLQILGVDIIRSNKRPLVIEVNSNPGFKELEKATDIDVAGTIIEQAVSCF